VGDVSMKERLAVIETEIKAIRSDINELKDIIQKHVSWEDGKYESFKNDFAQKWVEKSVIGVSIVISAGLIMLFIGKL